MKNEPTPMATESHPPAPSVSHLQRREIQAPIAACLIHGFAKELGLDKALEISVASIREDAKKSGQAMAGQLGVNRVRLKVMHTNRAAVENTLGVQGLPCLHTPSQGKPCTPASLLIAPGF